MIQQLLVPQIWLQATPQARVVLARHFNLRRSGMPIIVTENGRSRVETDGYTVDDLRPMTVAAMQEYVDSKITDIIKLFSKCADKAARHEKHKVEG